jgi:hypothetical protein
MKMKMQIIQFESIVNLIQMKLRKMIHMMKNLMIQEFQYSVELHWIEMMTLDMFHVQFESVLKLMKVIYNQKSMTIKVL